MRIFLYKNFNLKNMNLYKILQTNNNQYKFSYNITLNIYIFRK